MVTCLKLAKQNSMPLASLQCSAMNNATPSGDVISHSLVTSDVMTRNGSLDTRVYPFIRRWIDGDIYIFVNIVYIIHIIHIQSLLLFLNANISS